MSAPAKRSTRLRSRSGMLPEISCSATVMPATCMCRFTTTYCSLFRFQPRYVPIPEPISKQVGDNLCSYRNSQPDQRHEILYLQWYGFSNAAGVAQISGNPTLTTTGNNEIVVEATVFRNTPRHAPVFFVRCQHRAVTGRCPNWNQLCPQQHRCNPCPSMHRENKDFSNR